MELILSGGWIGREGLWRVKTSEPIYLARFEDIPPGKDLFLIISYDLSRDTLSVDIKCRGLPPIIVLPLEGFERFSGDGGTYRLDFVGMSLPEDGFIKGVLKVKDRIERGEVYQVNLTSEMVFRLEGDPLSLFLDFFGRQPVPYGFFLRASDLIVMSGSMELFLKRKGDRLVSRPVKGTGRTPEEILSKEKEIAENLMITDMMRNDLGRVARAGTVRVRELFRVEEFSTLCQMHSTVEAETEKDTADILRNTFPPASVTGAPKIKAVEVIDELEPHARGYYCGTAGILRRNGDFTFSVLIRTAYGSGNEISYFAGCGIVWDSDPRREFEELLLKARAFFPGVAGVRYGSEEVCKRSSGGERA
ncbi:MAG: anthranilate synthase component I family protein [Aquificota bacterium]|nr:anthranilate synthase component I family protein [Aquificota bacterium]